ncbi:MAG: cytochrome c3 family protein [Deltaproteobacteria bacterium]|nr:cytochrome c3 family protein [Deltaproteobacteria bacterium]
MRKQAVSIAVILGALALPLRAAAFECKVCHSKNPGMVAMHKALQGRNCFDCHRVGEKLMGKSAPKGRDSLLKRRVTEAECLPCHKSP